MQALRHSSSRFAGSLSFHTSSTLVGLVRKGSKGAHNARFITGAATADVDVDSSDLKEPSNHKYNNIENHLKGQQTESSLNNTSTINIQKKHESENDQFTKAKFTNSRKRSKFGDNVSKSQAHQGNNNSGALKDFLIACAPNEGANTSNNLNSATQDVQVPVPNDSSEENDDFSELDHPSTDLQIAKLAFGPSKNLLTNATEHVRMSVTNGGSEENDDFSKLDFLTSRSQSTKLATKTEKCSLLRKKQRPSANFEATRTDEDFFCKVLDSVSTSSRSIPVREAFVNRSDFKNNTGRRVDNTQLPESRFTSGDDQRVGKENKDEQAGKQKSMNQVKESSTILEGERSIRIEYVPRGIGLFHLREALSIHGEIVGSFFQNEDSAMPTCYIEFKTVEAKERALAARWVFVNGKQLSIWRSDFPVTTIARITNLSSEISATTVRSVCMSYGNVESLQARKDGSIDVQYSTDEILKMPKILEMLNEVAINDIRWIARPAPRLPKGLAKTPEGQKWAGKQLSNHIGNTRKHLQLLRIYLEDMEELHSSVMHIKEHPKLASNESFSTI